MNKVTDTHSEYVIFFMLLNANNGNSNALQYYLICTLLLLVSLNSICYYPPTRNVYPSHTDVVGKAAAHYGA
jgi:hypothetical protein